MKSRNLFLPFALLGLLLAGACGGSSNQQEEVPAEVTPVDDADRGRYNINEDTEAVISLDSVDVDSTHLNRNP